MLGHLANKIKNIINNLREKIKFKINFLKQYRWIFRVSVLTLVLAIFISIFSEMLLRNVNTFVAFLVLLIIVFTGVIFDAIGIAVATASEKPFHSMASKKIESAKFSLKLIKNASKVSNFCNDVIGDICGIISGAATTIIVASILISYNDSITNSMFTIFLSGIVASLTVGGKAVGKEIAMSKSKEIVEIVGSLLEKLYKYFKISIIK